MLESPSVDLLDFCRVKSWGTAGLGRSWAELFKEKKKVGFFPSAFQVGKYLW